MGLTPDFRLLRTSGTKLADVSRPTVNTDYIQFTCSDCDVQETDLVNLKVLMGEEVQSVLRGEVTEVASLGPTKDRVRVGLKDPLSDDVVDRVR